MYQGEADPVTRLRRSTGDDGVSLVLALAFLVIVGLFATVALTKSTNTATTGRSLRDRGQLQYNLDGAIDKGLQVVRSDMTSTDPATCSQASSPTSSGTLALNGHTSNWTCSLIAGRAKKSTDISTTDYALVVTSPSDGSLTTQSCASCSLDVGGAVYLNGKVANGDLTQSINLTSGDLVSPSSRSGCEADLAALTNMTTATGFLKTCTEQAVTQALPIVSLPTAPTYDVSTLLASGLSVAGCRVFYPGLYTAQPILFNGANYFVSGLYYFNNIGSWQFTGNNLRVTGGQRAVTTDSPALAGACSGMSDATALAAAPLAVQSAIASYTYANGVTWVLSGNSAVDARRGAISLYSPPRGSSSQPMSLVAFSAPTGGYAAIAGGNPTILSGFSNNTQMIVNGKTFAPSADANFFSTNNTSAVTRGGLVAFTVELQASSPGSGSLVISAEGGAGTPPPPFRTIKLVSAEPGNIATNTAVATVSNFSPYSVIIKSWRTS